MFYCLFTCIGYYKKFLVLWGMEPQKFSLCALMLFWALSYRELCYELSHLVHSCQVSLHPAWVNNIKCLIWVKRTRKMANISVYFSLENLSYSIYLQTLLILLMLAVCTNKPSNDLIHQSLWLSSNASESGIRMSEIWFVTETLVFFCLMSVTG